jgi:hypothetical protein
MSDIFDDRKKALEEEYFRRKEQESIEKMRQKMEAETQAQEAEAKRLDCPRGHGKMETLTFESVEIDRCETCGGVWLDKGELEQLRQKEEGGWFSRWR